MKCEICISPLVYEVNTIEWYFNSSSNKNVTNELIQSAQNILVSQNNKHLKMYNIQVYVMRTITKVKLNLCSEINYIYNKFNFS